MKLLNVSEYLSSEDWAVILIYLAGITGLGVWFGKDQKNTKDYFLGSRNVPWWGVGLSIVATETSALTFIGVPAMAYGDDNLTFIQIVIGYVIARIILAVVMVPHYFKGEIYSPYQLFSRAFGAGASRLPAAFFLIAGTLAAGVRVYVTCIPIHLMMGIEIFPAIVLFVALSLIYTYVGGIKAVIWTDAAQFVLFVAGGIFALVYIPSLFEGGLTEVGNVAETGNKFHWLNTQFSLAMPFNIWMGIFGATFQVMASHGADQLIVQRVLTCKSVADGRKSLILSAVIILPLFLAFLLTGTMLWAYYRKFALAIPLPETTAGFKQTQYIFPIFILTAVPNLFKGFLIVGILSAAMSSVSSALSALASVSTMDFFQGLSKKERTEGFYLRFSKYSTVFWAVMLIVVAYLSREVTSVLNVAFELSGWTSGAMLGGLLLAVFWKRGDSRAVALGMISSLGVMIAISPLVWPQGLFGGRVQIAWPWFTLIGTAVTVAVAWTSRRMSKAKRRKNDEGRTPN
ncbi:MAG TPA: sodium:solute symporter [Candidatus Eisenbacteria bacterium]|nr:sodium:solute symporter [Candidatus Eisenbacteria bacterium]